MTPGLPLRSTITFMRFTPDPRIPKWQSVAEDLIGRVQRGDIPPGSSFPSMRTIQQTYECSAGTARHAQQFVEEKGVIIKRPHGMSYLVRAHERGALTAARSPRRGASRGRPRITPEDLRRVLDIYAAKGVDGIMRELGYGERNARRLLARARKELQQ